MKRGTTIFAAIFFAATLFSPAHADRKCAGWVCASPEDIFFRAPWVGTPFQLDIEGLMRARMAAPAMGLGQSLIAGAVPGARGAWLRQAAENVGQNPWAYTGNLSTAGAEFVANELGQQAVRADVEDVFAVAVGMIGDVGGLAPKFLRGWRMGRQPAAMPDLFTGETQIVPRSSVEVIAEAAVQRPPLVINQRALQLAKRKAQVAAGAETVTYWKVQRPAHRDILIDPETGNATITPGWSRRQGGAGFYPKTLWLSRGSPEHALYGGGSC